MDTQVRHDEKNNRYEIYLAGSRVGLMDYRTAEGDISLTHTEVNPEQQGKNLAAILLRESLKSIREIGNLKVIPICSYAVKYMEKHPETQDLLKNPIEDAIASCRWPGIQ